jgi:hypothetical protein
MQNLEQLCHDSRFLMVSGSLVGVGNGNQRLLCTSKEGILRDWKWQSQHQGVSCASWRVVVGADDARDPGCPEQAPQAFCFQALRLMSSGCLYGGWCFAPRFSGFDDNRSHRSICEGYDARSDLGSLETMQSWKSWEETTDRKTCRCAVNHPG